MNPATPRNDPPPEPGNGLRRLPAGLGAILLVVLIDLIGFSIKLPLFPAILNYYLSREGEGGILAGLVRFLEETGRSVAGEAGVFPVAVLFGGILSGLFSLLQFASAPIWGRWSDRLGRRRILLLTVSGNALGYLVWAFSGNFLLLTLSVLINGIMSGNLAVATAAVADLTSREKRSSGMGLAGVTFGLGFMLGPAIGGLAALVDLSGGNEALRSFGLNPFSLAALVAMTLALINLAWAWKRLPETNTSRSVVAAGDTVWGRLKGIFNVTQPEIRRANQAYFLIIFTFGGLQYGLTFLAAERLDFGPTQIALLLLYSGTIVLFGQGFIVRRAASFGGERKLALAGLILAAGNATLLAFAQNLQTFLAAMTLSGLSAITYSSMTTLASLYAPVEHQGRVLGGFRAVGSLGRAMGPVAIGLVYFLAGSRNTYLLCALLLLPAFWVTLGLPQPSYAPRAESGEELPPLEEP